MTHPKLRLVMDGDDGEEMTFGLPSSGSTDLHIHLHLGVPRNQEVGVAGLVPTQSRRSAGWLWGRRVLGGAGALMVLFLVYDFGAHSSEGRAQSDILQLARANIPASRVPLPYHPAPIMPSIREPVSAPVDPRDRLAAVPPEMYRMLAHRPTVTPPPGAERQGEGPAAFGLHP